MNTALPVSYVAFQRFRFRPFLMFKITLLSRILHKKNGYTVLRGAIERSCLPGWDDEHASLCFPFSGAFVRPF